MPLAEFWSGSSSRSSLEPVEPALAAGRREASSCLETDAALPLLLLISAWQRRLQFRGPINTAHYIHSRAG